MKVDMSAKAVTARLRTMEELWLLSIKLMNNRSARIKRSRRTATRALEVYDSIRQVLMKDWDPIGITDEGRDDEYDSYIAPVYRVLVGNRSENAVITVLLSAEQELLGETSAEPESLRPIAKKLLDLDVRLEATK